MARHSVKEIEDAAIALLLTPTTFSYLAAPIRSYENDIEDMIESGEIIDGPRIWTYYAGSDFPRSDIDNAYVNNESFRLIVVCYDNNYAGVEDAAAGDPLGQNHPGTRSMIEDVKQRLMANKPTVDAMPFILEAVERVRLPNRTMSAYTVTFRTEFDYGGPVSA